jgi:hypothetical protein
MEKINSNLVAPCGMNCALCKAHLRAKNPCIGCRNITSDAPKTILLCFMRTCTKREDDFCYTCLDYPCDHLKHLDQRYRGKYNMSEIENLEYIRLHRMDQFLNQQREQWQSDLGILCAHDKRYY